MSVFPAPAGVILSRLVILPDYQGFPRTCGGDPLAYKLVEAGVKFSPHLRG